MVIAKWGRKEWSVSRSSVLNISDMSFSFTQTADNNTSTEENKLTNQRGKELFPLKFSTVLYAGAGVDVRAEIKDWESLVTSVNYFYLGGELLGPALQLRKVSVTDVKTDDSGKMIYAKLSFEFKEYDQETSSVKTNVPPLEITASKESKIIKKEENEALMVSELNGIRKLIVRNSKRFSIYSKGALLAFIPLKLASFYLSISINFSHFLHLFVDVIRKLR